MIADFERDGWEIHRYEGMFAPMANGPKNVWLDVDADSVTVEHEAHDGTTSVTVPRDWLLAAIFAADAFRSKKETE